MEDSLAVLVLADGGVDGVAHKYSWQIIVDASIVYRIVNELRILDELVPHDETRGVI